MTFWNVVLMRLGCLLLVLLAVSLDAQTGGTGALTVSITDQSGAVVAGASVTRALWLAQK